MNSKMFWYSHLSKDIPQDVVIHAKTDINFCGFLSFFALSFRLVEVFSIV